MTSQKNNSKKEDYRYFGPIRKTGRLLSLRLVNFRIEPHILEILNKMPNKSRFIRIAIKEKLKNG